MTYSRTIPRDLFNEASLLKCLGYLWIQLERTAGHHRAALSQGAGQPFQIEQDPSDGSIYVANLTFGVHGSNVHLFRPLNSRERFPLWARFGDPLGDFEDVEVFDAVGQLSEEFEQRIGVPA